MQANLRHRNLVASAGRCVAQHIQRVEAEARKRAGMRNWVATGTVVRRWLRYSAGNEVRIGDLCRIQS